jgi:diguanylate cyclase (GGDEF)-like protein
MLEKLYASYDDNNYYIETNKKKLAHDNINVIGGMLTFFLIVSAIFVALAMTFGDGITPYVKFLPSVAVMLVMFLINRRYNRKQDHTLESVRIYALINYTIVIFAFSVVDVIVFNTSRAVFFPLALVLLSSLYMDYFWVVTGYKIIACILFIIIDFQLKGGQYAVYDMTVAVLAILASGFAFSTIVSTTLSRHEDSEVLVQKSQTDLLTGLLNKISFEERCTEYLGKRVIGARCTMFIFDLDDFKDINDKFGHQTGDKTLKLFSEILKGYFHPDDIIGRVGGDEFMVLVLGDMPDGFAERRCRSVIHELKTTDIEGAKGITCSIGIAEDTQGHSFQELYEKADRALYEAKEGGKARFAFETF